MKTHPRKLAALLLLSACCFTPAAIYAATMASQPWVTNRIAEAEARTDVKIAAATNAIPAPGDYATVSNRAMSALQAHQPLTPATNYANQVARDSTNYTDAVAGEFSDGTRTVSYSGYSDTSGFASSAGSLIGDGTAYNATDLIRESTNAAVAVAGSATNGIPEAIGKKQDALPYPTNEIPYAAISGAPSGGGQEWLVVNYDVEVDAISFVTNGMANIIFRGGGIVGAVITNGWPDGASMFVRGQFSAETSYIFGSNVRLVGYGTWPTNNFQSVWWRSGTNIFVNVLVEE